MRSSSGPRHAGGKWQGLCLFDPGDLDGSDVRQILAIHGAVDGLPGKRIVVERGEDVGGRHLAAVGLDARLHPEANACRPSDQAASPRPPSPSNTQRLQLVASAGSFPIISVPVTFRSPCLMTKATVNEFLALVPLVGRPHLGQRASWLPRSRSASRGPGGRRLHQAIPEARQ